MQLEWVDDRLANWARWLQERAEGGLGYPRQSTFLRLGGVASSVDTYRIPVDSVQAQAVNSALQALRFESPGVWLAVWCVWVGHPDDVHRYRRPLSQVETAARLCCTDRTVRNRLDVARLWLAQRLSHQRTA